MAGGHAWQGGIAGLRGGGGLVSQQALQVSRPIPRGSLRGLARGVSRPTPRGEVEGSGLGGLQAHTWGGSPGPQLGGCILACTEAEPPLPQMATAAGGTHPTGMHSCVKMF